MSKRDTIVQRTEELLEPILKEKNYDLWDVEYVKEGQDMYLRAYIDKEGGITINDCVEVSRALSDALDVDDFVEDDSYILEVSSPGLGRKLVKDKEFERSLGRSIDVKFYRPVDGTKEVSGILKGYDKETLTIEINDEEKCLTRKDIALVKLTLDI